MTKKTLVIRDDHLGDLILTTPLIETFSRNGHLIDVIARKNNIPILEGNPFINEFFALEDIEPAFPKKWASALRWVRSKKYEFIIAPNAFNKEITYIASFSGAKTKILFQSGLLGRILLNTCLRSGVYSNPRHMTDVWLDAARYLKVNNLYRAPRIFLTDMELKRGKDLLNVRFSNTNQIIGVHPGSSGNSCNFPFNHYNELVDSILRNTDFNVVVTGSKTENEKIEKWVSIIEPNDRIWNSAGALNLRELSAVISHMDWYICSSTGPLHIANAMKTSTFSPFCSRIGHSPTFWGNTNGLAWNCIVKSPFCKKNDKVNCFFNGSYSIPDLFRDFQRVTTGSGK